MKALAKFGLGLIINVLAVSFAHAQSGETGCELHIWPTATYGAIFYGARNFRYAGPNASMFDLVISPREAAKRKLELAFPVSEEVRILPDVIARSPKFSGYRVVVHEPPLQPRYPVWYDKSVGFGARESDSTSNCYAEIHIIFITIEKTALSKKFETGFIFRRFGEKPNTIGVESMALLLV